MTPETLAIRSLIRKYRLNTADSDWNGIFDSSPGMRASWGKRGGLSADGLAEVLTEAAIFGTDPVDAVRAVAIAEDALKQTADYARVMVTGPDGKPVARYRKTRDRDARPRRLTASESATESERLEAAAMRAAVSRNKKCVCPECGDIAYVTKPGTRVGCWTCNVEMTRVGLTPSEILSQTRNAEESPF